MPISIIGGSSGDSRIAIVPSDLLMVAIAFTYTFSHNSFSRKETLIPMQIIFVICAFTLAAFTALKNGNILPLYSFIKFCKIFMAFFAGYALCRWYGRDSVLSSLADAAAVYIVLGIVSQFLYHQDFRPRFGENFFEFPIYGFPNSPSSYLVFLLCVALIKVRTVAEKWGLLICASIIAIGSLSRSALVLMVLAIIAFSFESPKKFITSIFVMISGVATLFLFDLQKNQIITSIIRGTLNRYDGAQAKGDLSNGRLNIFSDTLDLISQRPVFGFKFESFSMFGSHGTPHNQYLEVMFKLGIVGFIFYMIIIVVGLLRVVQNANPMPANVSKYPIYIMMGLVMLGNLAQPNLSYSVTGNLVFLLFGVFAIMPKISSQKSTARHLKPMDIA